MRKATRIRIQASHIDRCSGLISLWSSKLELRPDSAASQSYEWDNLESGPPGKPIQLIPGSSDSIVTISRRSKTPKMGSQAQKMQHSAAVTKTPRAVSQLGIVDTAELFTSRSGYGRRCYHYIERASTAVMPSKLYLRFWRIARHNIDDVRFKPVHPFRRALRLRLRLPLLQLSSIGDSCRRNTC